MPSPSKATGRWRELERQLLEAQDTAETRRVEWEVKDAARAAEAAAAQETIVPLRRQLATAVGNEQNAALTEEVAQLRSLLQRSEDDVAKMEKSMDEGDAARRQLVEDKGHIIHQLVMAKQAVATAEAAAASMRAELEALRQSAAVAKKDAGKASVGTEKAALEMRIASLTAEREERDKKLSVLETTVGSLSAQLRQALQSRDRDRLQSGNPLQTTISSSHQVSMANGPAGIDAQGGALVGALEGGRAEGGDRRTNPQPIAPHQSGTTGSLDQAYDQQALFARDRDRLLSSKASIEEQLRCYRAEGERNSAIREVEERLQANKEAIIDHYLQEQMQQQQLQQLLQQQQLQQQQQQQQLSPHSSPSHPPSTTNGTSTSSPHNDSNRAHSNTQANGTPVATLSPMQAYHAARAALSTPQGNLLLSGTPAGRLLPPGTPQPRQALVFRHGSPSSSPSQSPGPIPSRSRSQSQSQSRSHSHSPSQPLPPSYTPVKAAAAMTGADSMHTPSKGARGAST